MKRKKNKNKRDAQSVHDTRDFDQEDWGKRVGSSSSLRKRSRKRVDLLREMFTWKRNKRRKDKTCLPNFGFGFFIKKRKQKLKTSTRTKYLNKKKGEPLVRKSRGSGTWHTRAGQGGAGIYRAAMADDGLRTRKNTTVRLWLVSQLCL